MLFFKNKISLSFFRKTVRIFIRLTWNLLINFERISIFFLWWIFLWSSPLKHFGQSLFYPPLTVLISSPRIPRFRYLLCSLQLLSCFPSLSPFTLYPGSISQVFLSYYHRIFSNSNSVFYFLKIYSDSVVEKKEIMQFLVFLLIPHYIFFNLWIMVGTHIECLPNHHCIVGIPTALLR